MTVPVPKRWELLSALPILAGLYWLLSSVGEGWVLLGLVPGSLLLATGVALLLMPGDARITQWMAAGGFLGVVLTPLVWIFGSFGSALTGGLLAAAGFLVAGRVALTRDMPGKDVEPPDMTIGLDAKVALDEALLAYFVGTARIPSEDHATRLAESIGQMEEALEKNGWLKKPAGMHSAPPPPDRVYVQQARIYGHDYERITYPSAFTPDQSLPGASAWTTMTANGQCAAWVFRHAGQRRPWLLGIHGYRMGEPWMDFGLFSPGLFHRRLGLNMFLPILPLHGPRRCGVRSGDRYLDGDPLDLVHAETQALWDLRRAIAWIRSQEEDARIGVLGFSLGAYNAALLSQYEKDLDFVIAGIPVVDFAQALWSHIPPDHRAYYESLGLSPEHYSRILSPVSPLARKPLPSKDSLRIFAGVGDRVAPPAHALLLSKHWGRPVDWFQGAHLTFRGAGIVNRQVAAALQQAGWEAGSVAV